MRKPCQNSLGWLKKQSILEDKNLLHMEANSFLLEYSPFQKKFDVQKGKQEVTKFTQFPEAQPLWIVPR